jgi:mannose-6-phosphate isomerase-like protein (cupin superfamily)
MNMIRKEDLPFIGSSFNFVGAKQGDVGISMFLVEANPGHGAPLHFHEYDEIAIVQEGNSRFVIGDEIQDATAGNIVVVKAGTPHGFINSGVGLLKQIDIHISPHFKQQILDSTDTSRKAHLPFPDNDKGEAETNQSDD